MAERVEDPNAWREQVREARAEKFGWTAFKFQGDGVPPKADPGFREPGHDPYARNLTAKDIRRIVKGMEIVREELGPDIDFAIECHWRYDVRDVIELAKYIDWWQDLVIHEGPIFDGGYLTIQDKPGYGVEINPDVAKAHLAPGETWWM